MSQTDVDPAHSPEPDPDGTSDRLYTTTELEAFAEQQLEAARSGEPVDPLTDPIPHAGPIGEHTAMRPHPAARPTAPPPSSPPPSSPPPSYRSAPPSAPPAPAHVEPRRFMTATDFLDRRDDDKEPGPATWGWRGRVRRWSGGLLKPAMGAKERAWEADRALI